MLVDYNSPFGFWDVQHVAVIIKCTPDRGATIEAVAEDGTLRPFSLGAVYRKGEHISKMEFVKRFPFAALMAL
ncbi:MAG: hypothetical protein MUP13_05160 [Thermoanaerobaculales bacterium]|nr:hypothetical protein [Thermoanaerobaculales bacterium]